MDVSGQLLATSGASPAEQGVARSSRGPGTPAAAAGRSITLPVEAGRSRRRTRCTLLKEPVANGRRIDTRTTSVTFRLHLDKDPNRWDWGPCDHPATNGTATGGLSRGEFLAHAVGNEAHDYCPASSTTRQTEITLSADTRRILGFAQAHGPPDVDLGESSGTSRRLPRQPSTATRASPHQASGLGLQSPARPVRRPFF